MICNKCNGTGFVQNKRYYNYIRAEAFERGIEPTKKCYKCKGTGYIISNISDILTFLKHLQIKFKKDKEYLQQVNYCINVIEHII